MNRRSEAVCPVPVGHYPRRQPVKPQPQIPPRPTDFDAVVQRLQYLFAYVEKHVGDGPGKEHMLDEVVNISKQVERAAARVMPSD